MKRRRRCFLDRVAPVPRQPVSHRRGHPVRPGGSARATDVGRHAARQEPISEAARVRVGPRVILGAVSGELAEVQRASRGGWTAELAGRALSALRIAGSYATGRAVGQRPVKGLDVGDRRASCSSAAARPLEALVSGSVTPSPPQRRGRGPGRCVTRAGHRALRPGRTDRLHLRRSGGHRHPDPTQQRSAHSLISEWSNAFVQSIADPGRVLSQRQGAGSGGRTGRCLGPEAPRGRVGRLDAAARRRLLFAQLPRPSGGRRRRRRDRVT